MTHAVVACPPDRPGGVVVGKTAHVWYPPCVRGRPCYPALCERAHELTPHGGTSPFYYDGTSPKSPQLPLR
eukprot:2351570-Prymnesium_polylepis.1